MQCSQMSASYWRSEAKNLWGQVIATPYQASPLSRSFQFQTPRYSQDPTLFLKCFGSNCSSKGATFSCLFCQVYWRTVLDEMNITFSKPPNCILQINDSPESKFSSPGGQWLPGAVFNPAKDCLSLNENRSLDDVAIIWRDEGYDDLPLKRLTLRELRAEVWYITIYLISSYFSS